MNPSISTVPTTSPLTSSDLDVIREVASRVVIDYLAVKPNEKFLFVTDPLTSPEIVDAILNAAWASGNDATHVVIKARAYSGEEPPELVARAMIEADVCLALASRSLYHTNAKGAAQRSGTRGCMNGPHLASAWSRGAMTTDFLALRQTAVMVADRLRGHDLVRVTSPAGTDITVALGGRQPQAWLSGVCHNPGEVSAYPAGEVSFPPLEGTSNGRIVIERIMTDVGTVNNPITLTITNGECTKIEGGAEAERLRAIIKDVPGATNLGELGIGLNKDARIGELITESKKAYGTVHFALGDNAGGYGGVVESPVHLDGLNMNATIVIDGEVLFSDGHLVG